MTSKAIIFDLDGTLIDSAPDIAAAVNRYLEPRGRGPLSAERVARFIGNGPRKLMADILADQKLPVDEATLAEAHATYLENYNRHPAALTEFYANVREDLALLAERGFRLGICTNKPHALTQKILSLLQIDHMFEAAIGADAVKDCKPHPDHLAAVWQAMGISPRQVIYVGDSDVDRMTAQRAGVPFFAVNWGTGADVAVEPAFRLHRLADIVAHTEATHDG
ncbi:phosphoglycolate phosphatase [Devosia elaeis]|uniref:phosphoglycolate phosphatase n=1 Tax=Devosia elaeis TaxID=1770058 RepID=A0A178HJF8_9HYPH|nr:phosphoglycolate phosphatase [Devosia elaeis]OAM72971.1 phosphoglycolate phosphatase [Devosia elaeis]